MTTLSIENQQTSRYGLVFASNLTSQQSKNLSDASFRLWIILHTYAPCNPGDGWTVGAERLADDAGFSRSTFFRALAQLKEQKLVMVHNKASSGRPNRYVLVNATGVKTLLGGHERGVNSDSPEFDSSHSSDTGEGHLVTLNTGALTGASNSNNPPNPPGGENETELQGLIMKSLKTLYERLEYHGVESQMQFLLGDLANWTKAETWNKEKFDVSFKQSCLATYRSNVQDHVFMEIEHLTPPESGRKRTHEKRVAFLTEAREAIREYGRQL